ncbi:hypothetical protein A2U01_0037299, partial [Trifolium medium]|nr:hypothetical protein [Trifolium medium]
KATTDPGVDSVKEKTTTPDAAQDVGASMVQSNPNTATITESFDDSSDKKLRRLRSKTVPRGIGRRLRSRTTKPAPTANVTPAATKKVKDPPLKPVKYGPVGLGAKAFPHLIRRREY